MWLKGRVQFIWRETFVAYNTANKVANERCSCLIQMTWIWLSRVWKLNITEYLDNLVSFMWNKTNIVKLIRVTQHKLVGTSNIILWAGHYVMVMRQTADHMDASFKAVCSTTENHVITPCTMHLPPCLWGKRSNMNIHQQSGRDLSHPAVREKML